MQTVSFTVPVSVNLRSLPSLSPEALGNLLQAIDSVAAPASADARGLIKERDVLQDEVASLGAALAKERDGIALQVATAFREGSRVDTQLRQIDSALSETKSVIDRAFGASGAPREKGEAGEVLVKEWFVREYPLAGITSVSSEPRSMDFIVKIRQGHSELKLMIEIKNKTKTTKDDRDKFERDVLENKHGAQAAVFLSLAGQEDIPCRGKFQIASVGGVTAIYIARATAEDFAVLRSAVDMLLYMHQVGQLQAVGPDVQSVCDMLSAQGSRLAAARLKIASGMKMVEEGFLLLKQDAGSPPLTEVLTGIKGFEGGGAGREKRKKFA